MLTITGATTDAYVGHRDGDYFYSFVDYDMYSSTISGLNIAEHYTYSYYISSERMKIELLSISPGYVGYFVRIN